MDIGSGDGLMPLGNKPLPEPMLTQIYVTISSHNELTHWGRVTHICVSKVTIIGPDNGLSPGRRQAIIWTNAGLLSIRPLETNFSEIFIKIHIFSFNKIHLKMSVWKMASILSRPQWVKACTVYCYSHVLNGPTECVRNGSFMDGLLTEAKVCQLHVTWGEGKKWNSIEDVWVI